MNKLHMIAAVAVTAFLTYTATTVYRGHQAEVRDQEQREPALVGTACGEFGAQVVAFGPYAKMGALFEKCAGGVTYYPSIYRDEIPSH